MAAIKVNRHRRAAVIIESRETETLHWAYLEFAIRSSVAKLSKTKKPSIPARRNVLEAIRYSYDFIDAATEFARASALDDRLDGRQDTWLMRHVERSWGSLSLADRLGFLTYSYSGEGFWSNEGQRQLFDELRAVRNALTHPALFGGETLEEFDQDTDAVPSRSTRKVVGKLRPGKVAGFAGTLNGLGRTDARKAVEISLRHAERLEQLFGSPGRCRFGRVNPRTHKAQAPGQILAGMRARFFDTVWAG